MQTSFGWCFFFVEREKEYGEMYDYVTIRIAGCYYFWWLSNSLTMKSYYVVPNQVSLPSKNILDPHNTFYPSFVVYDINDMKKNSKIIILWVVT